MAGRITVIGEGGVAPTLPEGARGADVVVAAAGADVAEAVRRAPAAVLRLGDAGAEDVARMHDQTSWPRQRVLGVRRRDVETAARAVAEGQEARLRATLRDGEAEVVVGRAGVRLP